MSSDFDTFFQATTGNMPYDYQRRLAGGDAGCACESRLISIPTGLGKTAAVVLAWLWNRVVNDPLSRGVADGRGVSWPRRLVYCLPMRTLVEQTRDNTQLWILRLALAATEHGSAERAVIDSEVQRIADTIDTEEQRKRWIADVYATWSRDRHPIEAVLANELRDAREDLVWLATHSPVVLMGGEELEDARRDWDIHPERPAILIGTQDMLLSRALNRGYGMSRYRWPMHFGLLNNDALWVFDELQLMGVSVETSAQLNAFRARLGTATNCSSWWMSATLDADRLRTVDHSAIATTLPRVELSPDEKRSDPVSCRIDSFKKLARSEVALSKATEGNYDKSLAAFVLQTHQAGSFTLVIVNRVGRAQKVFRALQKATAKQGEAPALALVHSRFRPPDRVRHTGVLTDKSVANKIVVATQAVEAGVDVSAKTLITELAPWSSLVQRFGRCNRAGEITDPNSPARVCWIDIDAADKDELALPYAPEELAAARAALQPLVQVGPQALASVNVPPREIVRPVIRRKDFVDLFDTTPDIAGHDLDVSRYIREGDDNDAQVCWRNLGDDGPASSDAQPIREALCRVPFVAFNEFVRKQKANAYVWDPLERAWIRVARVRPGSVCIIDPAVGGYDAALGWTADKKSAAVPVADDLPDRERREDETYEEPVEAQMGAWQSIAEHTADVLRELESLLRQISVPADFAESLRCAARWHDIGKAHPAFQAKLKLEALQSTAAAGHHPVAKAPRTAWKTRSENSRRENRRYFRHELASALALLARPELLPETSRDLVAYLVAAHHGKVRLSIRSLPGESVPDDPGRRVARGVWEGDELPAVTVGEGATIPKSTLSLACMELGARDDGTQPSWFARAIALRDAPDLGPLRLAWLETLLRAADCRVSAAG